MRILLASLGLLAIVTVGVYLWIQRDCPPGWSRFCKELDGECERWQTDQGKRAPLLGPALPGNAWDDYLAITPEIDEKRADPKLLARAMDAVRRDRARHPSTCVARWTEPVHLRPLLWLANHLTAEARRALERGDWDGAVNHVAAAIQLSLDVGRLSQSAFGPSEMVSPVTSKPATAGQVKTSHAINRYSYAIVLINWSESWKSTLGLPCN